MFYEADPDCEVLNDEFTYRIMGSIPVEGPYTSTGLYAQQNLHAYGAFGLEPDADATPVVFQVTEYPPFGEELARCTTQRCEFDDGTAEEPEALAMWTDYNLYEGWYFVRTNANSYYARDGTIKDQVRAWFFGEFCDVIPAIECAEENPEFSEESDEEPTRSIIAMQGFSQHGDASYMVNFDDDFDDSYLSMVYCPSVCYDHSTYQLWEVQGYDYVTDYDIVYKYYDYDVGTSGGQFMFVRYADQQAAWDALSEQEQLAYWGAMESYVLKYFTWFGSSSFLPDGFGSDYTFDDLVWTYFFDQPSDFETWDYVNF